MRTSDFEYELPAGRIAQTPVEPRDGSRLMVIDRADGAIAHRRFHDLDRLLRPGDLLVANDSRVIPARLPGRKQATGGAVEVLLLRRLDDRTWESLVRGRVRPGTRLVFGDQGVSAAAEVTALHPLGVRHVRFDEPIDALLEQLGQTPLPPYITTALADGERYQTVYARVAGSAAAPTAGLHFTPRLIERLKARGIGFAFVTLHVGLDTFRPVDGESVAEHAMHSEWASMPSATADAVREARSGGGRIVAIGTTSVRVLETAARGARGGDPVAPYEGWTDLFITPGHAFAAVDVLITNFHLPRSTLLMLVAAFAGKGLMDDAYASAIAGDYRFYSFGDAMLIR